MPNCTTVQGPRRFSELFTGDLPLFLQTGAAHVLKRPMMIIDPRDSENSRCEPLERFDSYESFCRCLRSGCDERCGGPNWDAACSSFDVLVARRLLKLCQDGVLSAGQPMWYRCYIGLQEIAVVKWIGRIPVMFGSGQFLPPNGVEDIEVTLSCLGRMVPPATAVSRELAESMMLFAPPSTLWTETPLPERHMLHLLVDHALEMATVPEGYEALFMSVVNRIVEVATTYHDMAIRNLEFTLTTQLSEALRTFSVGTDLADGLWSGAAEVLDELRAALDLEYVAFFAGDSASDTILRFKVSAGVLPEPVGGTVYPPFNWRKARLKTHDARDTQQQTKDAAHMNMSDVGELKRGFGDYKDTLPCAALIPVHLDGGPYSLLVAGPPCNGTDESLLQHEALALNLCRRVCTRILELYAGALVRADRLEWQQTATMTGHRVRASLQSVRSQIRTIRAVDEGKPGFTPMDRIDADRDLERAIEDLDAVSKAGEQAVHSAIDVAAGDRHQVRLGEIILAAVSYQDQIAQQEGVEIRVAEDVARLPTVFVNPTLMRYAFANIINNGLKYSYPDLERGERYLTVKVPCTSPELFEARVEVVNFGLGIMKEDLDTIFDFGVRLAPAEPTFKETFGQGVGLWEAKRVVVGHGGKILVSSLHHSGTAVTARNQAQCITVFTVCLPVG